MSKVAFNGTVASGTPVSLPLLRPAAHQPPVLTDSLIQILNSGANPFTIELTEKDSGNSIFVQDTTNGSTLSLAGGSSIAVDVDGIETMELDCSTGSTTYNVRTLRRDG